jgi:hypothetical protein
MKGKLARPTIGDVAAKARVAPTTVSRVLNGGYVSAEVRARVEKVIKTLGYVPSPTRSRRRLPDVAQPARKHGPRRRLLQPKTRALWQRVTIEGSNTEARRRLRIGLMLGSCLILWGLPRPQPSSQKLLSRRSVQPSAGAGACSGAAGGSREGVHQVAGCAPCRPAHRQCRAGSHVATVSSSANSLPHREARLQFASKQRFATCSRNLRPMLRRSGERSVCCSPGLRPAARVADRTARDGKRAGTWSVLARSGRTQKNFPPSRLPVDSSRLPEPSRDGDDTF